MELEKTNQKEDKVFSLKKKLETYGFNETFNEDNFELLDHIMTDFNKLVLSFKLISSEKNSLEDKNKILENEIETLKEQINSLLEKNILESKMQDKLNNQLNEKKKLLSEINELKKEMSDMKKDNHLLELTIEKNKSSIEFLKIENENYADKENVYKQKISKLLNQNSEIKDEKEKYYDMNQNSSQKFEEMSQKMKILEEKNENLEKNKEKMDKEGGNIRQLLKEKNKAVSDWEESNSLLRKDLEIMNGKLKDVINENENIKKINKDLFKDKNELQNELKNLKIQMEELKINKANIENESKLINAENENIKYKNAINEKKIYMSNCEIQEMDKTIKYLKKNLEQIKMMSNTNDTDLSKMYCKMVCGKCGCVKKPKNKTIYNHCGYEINMNHNLYTFNDKEYDIQTLIENNKVLFEKNKELKNQLDNMAINLDLYINENNLAADRIFKLENFIKKNKK